MKKKLIRVIKNGLRLLSFIIPKKKGLLVFSPWHNKAKLSGNIKSLLLYADENYRNGNIVLIHSSTKNNVLPKNHKIKVATNFLSTYWSLVRAEFVIIDATIAEYATWNLSIIQLWHGVGFKKVGLLNRNNISKPEFYKKLKKHYQQYILVTAASDSDAEKKGCAFNNTRIKITGSPCNDTFFATTSISLELRRKYQLQEYTHIISYAPTYRDFETFAPFSKQFWSKLDAYLQRTNTVFIVKKHPWDKYLRIPDQFPNIKDLSAEIDDVQELLLITDLLITDYSSISTDFSITGKPILLYMYDLDKYLKTSRSFYYDLEEILPRPFINNEEDLMDKIKDQSWAELQAYQEGYTSFRNRFHKYLDGNSSQRVLNAIRELQD